LTGHTADLIRPTFDAIVAVAVAVAVADNVNVHGLRPSSG
jgi:hypothetical protein